MDAPEWNMQKPAARACVGDWSGSAYSYVKKFMGVIREKYGINERIGLTGGSYGGFMTNWIVTQTDMFRAAVILFTCYEHCWGFHLLSIADWGEFHQFPHAIRGIWSVNVQFKCVEPEAYVAGAHHAQEVGY